MQHLKITVKNTSFIMSLSAIAAIILVGIISSKAEKEGVVTSEASKAEDQSYRNLHPD